MDVGVVIQFLSPCVEGLYEGGHCSQVLFVCRQLKESLCRRVMEKGIQVLLVAEDDWPEFGRDGKNDMEISAVDHLGSPGVDPLFLQHRLAVRTVTVTAGIVVGHLMAAGITDADITSKSARFACHDGEGCLFLHKRNIMLPGIVFPGSPEYLLDGEIRHCCYPPSCPRG